MTEKDEWIEKEAREARGRYWNGGWADWANLHETIRDYWRRVVAPYYPEPVADAVALEKLAEIGEKAYKADKSNLVDEKWISATKAILRAAKPERLRGKQPETRPVKVRFNVTSEEMFWNMYDEGLPYPIDGVEGIALVQHAMDHILAHAVIDAPAGVQPREWSDADVEALTKVIHDAYYHAGKGWLGAADAALAYLNIEPCPAPEYVAFRDALKKSQEIVNNWTPEERTHNSIGYVGLQGNERNELANLREECDRLRYQLNIKREAMESMLAEISKLDAERGLLRSAHAVIDAPAEADELQRRLDAVVAMLEPGEVPNCMESKYNPAGRISIYDADRMVYDARHRDHARAVAIAEGRES